LEDGSLQRHCHGPARSRRGCGFTWPAAEDARYLYLSFQSVMAYLPLKAPKATD
jgi:hypothetical protein